MIGFASSAHIDSSVLGMLILDDVKFHFQVATIAEKHEARIP